MTYTHTVIVRVTKEQYNKVKKSPSTIIRELIENYDTKNIKPRLEN
jgi:hypothetical protein